LIFLVIIPFLTSKNTKDTKILGEWGRRNREQGIGNREEVKVKVNNGKARRFWPCRGGEVKEKMKGLSIPHSLFPIPPKNKPK
jgi:hypothetical protein